MAQLSTAVAAGTGIAVGAALMYAFDPDRGRARRAHLRDKLVHVEHELADVGRSGLHDLANRSRGLAHDVARVARPDYADDDVICERVRARIGRAIWHPGLIEVASDNGIVTLRGHVLIAEAPHLIHAVHGVHGVRGVVDELKRHDRPGNLPALQGRPRPRKRALAPGTRLVAGGIGALLLGRALRRLL